MYSKLQPMGNLKSHCICLFCYYFTLLKCCSLNSYDFISFSFIDVCNSLIINLVKIKHFPLIHVFFSTLSIIMQSEIVSKLKVVKGWKRWHFKSLAVNICRSYWVFFMYYAPTDIHGKHNSIKKACRFKNVIMEDNFSE